MDHEENRRITAVCDFRVQLDRRHGRPVVIEEEGQPEVIAESPRSGWIVPVVVGLVVLCAIACGNDDDPAAGTEE